MSVLLLFSLSQPVSPTPGPLILTAFIAVWIVRRTSLASRSAVQWLFS